MKKIFALALMTMVQVVCTYAQDVIVKKDGTVIKAKVLEVGESEIKYKKFESTSDRTYTVSVANLISINYEDGEVEKFDATPTAAPAAAPQQPGAPTITAATPTADNAKLIQRYNIPLTVTAEEKSSRAFGAFFVMGVAESSVLSTDELEISFESRITEKKPCMSGWSHTGGPFVVAMKNKTDKIIYVDLTSTFRTGKDGESHTYFSTDVVTSTSAASSGASFNLGGVAGALGMGGALGSLAGATTIGGGSTSTVSTTHQMERVMAIPPHGTKLLSALEVACAKRMQCKAISANEPMPGFNKREQPFFYADYYVFDHRSKLQTRLHEGQTMHFTPENTLGDNKYQITYTTDPNFMDIKTICFETYVRTMVGLRAIRTKNTKVGQEKLLTKQWGDHFGGDYSQYIFVIDYDPNFRGYGPKD